MTEQTPAPENRLVFTPEQEARVREIIREEIDADHALRDSRDHAWFVLAFEQERGFRPALESKRAGGTGRA